MENSGWAVNEGFGKEKWVPLDPDEFQGFFLSILSHAEAPDKCVTPTNKYFSSNSGWISDSFASR
jgi:hypothetical protein